MRDSPLLGHPAAAAAGGGPHMHGGPNGGPARPGGRLRLAWATLAALLVVTLSAVLWLTSAGGLAARQGGGLWAAGERRPWEAGPGKVAVLVETRADPRLGPVIANFASVLPLDWRLQLHLSEEAEARVRASPGLTIWMVSGRIEVKRFEGFKGDMNYNTLMQSEAFWQPLPGEHVLIFQLDTALCSGSPHKVDDFLRYDYIGAPWTALPDFECGNGGLSLRSKTRTLGVIAKTPPDRNFGEDGWHCRNMVKIGGATLAHPNVSKTFSVEAMWYDKPLGVHRAWHHLQADCFKRLAAFCPEALAAMPPGEWHQASRSGGAQGCAPLPPPPPAARAAAPSPGAAAQGRGKWQEK